MGHTVRAGSLPVRVETCGIHSRPSPCPCPAAQQLVPNLNLPSHSFLSGFLEGSPGPLLSSLWLLFPSLPRMLAVKAPQSLLMTESKGSLRPLSYWNSPLLLSVLSPFSWKPFITLVAAATLLGVVSHISWALPSRSLVACLHPQCLCQCL